MSPIGNISAGELREVSSSKLVTRGPAVSRQGSLGKNTTTTACKLYAELIVKNALFTHNQSPVLKPCKLQMVLTTSILNYQLLGL